LQTPPEASPQAIDRMLMERLRGGDREALTALMERHYRRLYRVMLGYLRHADDALDAVQETFVRAFEHAARWNPEAEVAPWLTRIAINQAIDRLRRRKRRQGSEDPLDAPYTRELPGDNPSPDRLIWGREIHERLARVLDTLPDGQRSVFVLRHYDQLSLEEIAQTLDIRLGTVKSSLHRALHHVRRRLGSLHS
jgi:RNA polymerase sigma-70 factor, ECF subfamily